MGCWIRKLNGILTLSTLDQSKIKEINQRFFIIIIFYLLLIKTFESVVTNVLDYKLHYGRLINLKVCKQKFHTKYISIRPTYYIALK